MTKHDLNSLLDKFSQLTPSQQEQVRLIVEQMSAQKSGALRLSNEQVAEVERRLADPEPRFMTLDEARARLRRHEA